MSRPRLYLSNWSSHQTPGHWGDAGAFTIMARPRAWERGMGRVSALTPPPGALLRVRDGAITMEEYLGDLLDQWTRPNAIESLTHLSTLVPGGMTYAGSGARLPVPDGATLNCACARHAACHRRPAAIALLRAGWDVVLDGDLLTMNDVQQLGGAS